jgi:hypothetical protein
MEAIKLIEHYWEQLKRLVIYAQYCAGSDLHAPVCRDFWLWSVVVSFCIAIFLIVLIAKRVIKEQLEFYRNKKRLEARAIVADLDTMNQHKWAGDDDNDVNLSHEDLAAEIRKATRSNNPSSGENA